MEWRKSYHDGKEIYFKKLGSVTTHAAEYELQKFYGQSNSFTLLKLGLWQFKSKRKFKLNVYESGIKGTLQEQGWVKHKNKGENKTNEWKNLQLYDEGWLLIKLVK